MNAMPETVSPQSSTGTVSQTATITLCGNYQVENFFDFQTGDHETETVNSTLALNGTGFVGATSPDNAVRLAVSGTITLGGLTWLPNPPDTFVFPRDLTANAANGNWQKFRFAADSYNSNTSSWTVTLQFIDDDCRDPWRADFDGSYCRLTVVAAPPRLSLTATDAAGATNHATAISEPIVNLPATVPDLYLAADATGAAHLALSADFGPSTLGGDPTGQYVHLNITPTSDPAIDDTYATLSGSLSDITLQSTPTVHDFAITAWLDANHDGYYETGEPTREVDVHIPTLSLEIDANHDGVINSTDDALEAQGPATIYEEWNSVRTAIQLTATCGGPANDLSVKVRNICGMEFWDAATGGNQLQVDGNGNIVDDPMPTSGQYSRTLWVSVDPTKHADFAQIEAILDPPPYLVLAQIHPRGGAGRHICRAGRERLAECPWIEERCNRLRGVRRRVAEESGHGNLLRPL